MQEDIIGRKHEWLVHIWGGAWNKDANPSIEKDYGIKKGYHYFSSAEDAEAFISVLSNLEYTKQGLMADREDGYLTHKETIFVGDFGYGGKIYTIHYNFGLEYDEESAISMFKEGNFACDCNRSMLIQEEYGEDAFPELGCGHEIRLISYHFEYADSKDENEYIHEIGYRATLN